MERSSAGVCGRRWAAERQRCVCGGRGVRWGSLERVAVTDDLVLHNGAKSSTRRPQYDGTPATDALLARNKHTQGLAAEPRPILSNPPPSPLAIGRSSQRREVGQRFSLRRCGAFRRPSRIDRRREGRRRRRRVSRNRRRGRVQNSNRQGRGTIRNRRRLLNLKRQTPASSAIFDDDALADWQQWQHVRSRSAARLRPHTHTHRERGGREGGGKTPFV